jgi:hypothetical protein
VKRKFFWYKIVKQINLKAQKGQCDTFWLPTPSYLNPRGRQRNSTTNPESSGTSTQALSKKHQHRPAKMSTAQCRGTQASWSGHRRKAARSRTVTSEAATGRVLKGPCRCVPCAAAKCQALYATPGKDAIGRSCVRQTSGANPRPQIEVCGVEPGSFILNTI